MPDGSILSIFIPTALALVAIPGPNTLYIMAKSMQQGLYAGMVSCLGIMAGTLVHISFAALGISALVLSSAVAFTLLKYIGAAYLVYLGIKTLRSSGGTAAHVEISSNQRLAHVFYQGIAVNVLNPKTALFFAAFLPQFIDIEKGGVAGQVVVLGLILIAVGGLSDMLYALFSGKISHVVKDNQHFDQGRRYGAGVIYIGLGIAAALTRAGKP